MPRKNREKWLKNKKEFSQKPLKLIKSRLRRKKQRKLS
jgi:hypothetical protein